MKKYSFDCYLVVAVTVPALDEIGARAALNDALQCADSNFGHWPDGSPIVAEASLTYGGQIPPPHLYAIDGEDVNG